MFRAVVPSLRTSALVASKMISVFRAYGVSVKAALLVLVGFVLIGLAARLGLASAFRIGAAVGVWAGLAFLLLPTRHLLSENVGPLRQLPKSDRRPARLIQVKQRELFDCVELVGFRSVKRWVKGKSRYEVAAVSIPQYPKLFPPAAAPYGFSFRVELPGCYGVTSARAVKHQAEIDAFICYLLRGYTPTVAVEVMAVSGSLIEIAVRFKDEFADVVLPDEVELCS